MLPWAHHAWALLSKNFNDLGQRDFLFWADCTQSLFGGQLAKARASKMPLQAGACMPRGSIGAIPLHEPQD